MLNCLHFRDIHFVTFQGKNSTVPFCLDMILYSMKAHMLRSSSKTIIAVNLISGKSNWFQDNPYKPFQGQDAPPGLFSHLNSETRSRWCSHVPYYRAMLALTATDWRHDVLHGRRALSFYLSLPVTCLRERGLDGGRERESCRKSDIHPSLRDKERQTALIYLERCLWSAYTLCQFEVSVSQYSDVKSYLSPQGHSRMIKGGR